MTYKKDPENRFCPSRKALALAVSVCLLAGSFQEAASAAEFFPGQPALFEVPSELGRLEEFSPGRSGKTVIFIQDAHDVLEAQENIAAMIGHFVKTAGVKTVYEEGYEGIVPTDELFEGIADTETKRKVSYYLMDRLRIGGAEYAHINRTEDFRLVGADSFEDHFENVRWYAEASRVQADLEAELGEAEKELANLIARLSSKPLQDFLRLKKRFEENQAGFTPYLKELCRLYFEASKTPAIEILFPRIADVLRALDTKQADALERVERLGAAELYSELNRLEETLLEALLADSQDRKPVNFYRTIRLLRRLNKLEIRPAEYEAVQESLKNFDAQSLADFLALEGKRTVVLPRRWEQGLSSARKFYETAFRRDEKIREAAETFLNQPEEKTTVLVYGGFHAGRIRSILEEAGLGYAVVVPAIQNIEERHREYYRKGMAAGAEAVLSGFAPGMARPISLFEISAAGNPETREEIGNEISSLGGIVEDLSGALPDIVKDIELRLNRSELRDESLAREWLKNAETIGFDPQAGSAVLLPLGDFDSDRIKNYKIREALAERLAEINRAAFESRTAPYDRASFWKYLMSKNSKRIIVQKDADGTMLGYLLLDDWQYETFDPLQITRTAVEPSAQGRKILSLLLDAALYQVASAAQKTEGVYWSSSDKAFMRYRSYLENRGLAYEHPKDGTKTYVVSLAELKRHYLRDVFNESVNEGFAAWELSAEKTPAAGWEREDLADFQYDPGLAKHEKVLITVKGMEQRATDQRALAARARQSGPEVIGGGTARAYKEGRALAFSLAHEELSEENSLWFESVPEPHDAAFSGEYAALGANNTIALYNRQTGQRKIYTHPWFAHIHTVQFSPDGRRLLAASSGFDTVFEIDIENDKITWEWNAWENGYNQSPLGHFLARSKEAAELFESNGETVLLTEDPAVWGAFGIPTRRRAVHLNSASYSDADTVLMTLFHQGKAIAVDKTTGRIREIFSGLAAPHGFRRLEDGRTMVVNTRAGSFFSADAEFRPLRELNFKSMAGVSRPEALGEWLQNMRQLDGPVFAAVDINRSRIWIIDLDQKKYRAIGIPRDWAVQDVHRLSDEWEEAGRQQPLFAAQAQIKELGRRSELRTGTAGWKNAEEVYRDLDRLLGVDKFPGRGSEAQKREKKRELIKKMVLEFETIRSVIMEDMGEDAVRSVYRNLGRIFDAEAEEILRALAAAKDSNAVKAIKAWNEEGLRAAPLEVRTPALAREKHIEAAMDIIRFPYIQAYRQSVGRKREAAFLMGLPPSTYRSRAEDLGIDFSKIDLPPGALLERLAKSEGKDPLALRRELYEELSKEKNGLVFNIVEFRKELTLKPGLGFLKSPGFSYARLLWGMNLAEDFLHEAADRKEKYGGLAIRVGESFGFETRSARANIERIFKELSAFKKQKNTPSEFDIFKALGMTRGALLLKLERDHAWRLSGFAGAHPEIAWVVKRGYDELVRLLEIEKEMKTKIEESYAEHLGHLDYAAAGLGFNGPVYKRIAAALAVDFGKIKIPAGGLLKRLAPENSQAKKEELLAWLEASDWTRLSQLKSKALEGHPYLREKVLSIAEVLWGLDLAREFAARYRRLTEEEGVTSPNQQGMKFGWPKGSAARTITALIEEPRIASVLKEGSGGESFEDDREESRSELRSGEGPKDEDELSGFWPLQWQEEGQISILGTGFEKERAAVEMFFSEFFSGVLEKEPAAKFADLGTGRLFVPRLGLETALAAGKSGAEFHGVDSAPLDPALIPKDRQIHFHQAAIEDLPVLFGQDSFDGATSSFGLEYARDPELALKALHRVLKPGAPAALVFHHTDSIIAESARERLWELEEIEKTGVVRILLDYALDQSAENAERVIESHAALQAAIAAAGGKETKTLQEISGQMDLILMAGEGAIPALEQMQRDLEGYSRLFRYYVEHAAAFGEKDRDRLRALFENSGFSITALERLEVPVKGHPPLLIGWKILLKKAVSEESLQAPEGQGGERSELRIAETAREAFYKPGHKPGAAMIDFGDLAAFTPEEIREAAVVISRRPEVRFVIHSLRPEDDRLLYFKNIFKAFPNVVWTQASGEEVFRSLGPQLRSAGIVAFARRSRGLDAFSAEARKKILFFAVEKDRPGTFAVALSYDPEQILFQRGVVRDGLFYVVRSFLAGLAADYLNQFAFAASA